MRNEHGEELETGDELMIASEARVESGVPVEDAPIILVLEPPERRWKKTNVRCVKAFLGQLTFYEARSRLRAETRRKHAERSAGEFTTSEDGGDLPREEIRDVHAAIEKLPEALRQCVDLRYYGKMRTVDIAEALGISQRTVQDRLDRARDRLRKWLEPGYGAAVLPLSGELSELTYRGPGPSPELRAKIFAAADDHFASEPERVKLGRLPGNPLLLAASVVAVVLGLVFVVLQFAGRSELVGTAEDPPPGGDRAGAGRDVAEGLAKRSPRWG